MTTNYNWVDDPTVAGVSAYDPDVLNECLMHLKYNNEKMPIGTLFPCVCSANWTPENALPVDGAEYASTQFPTLWTDFLTATTPKLATCSYEQYASDITTYGQCARFAVDIENGKFKVPTIKDGSYITQAKTDAEIGKAYNESLPNIKGEFGSYDWMLAPNMSGNGAFTVASGVKNTTNDQKTSTGGYSVSFDASGSSSVYQDNAKVQGDNVRLRWFVVVANGTVSQSAMDWSAWATSLAGRANTDLSNLSDIGKSAVSSYGMPDYSSGVAVTSPYTATYDCIFVPLLIGNASSMDIYVDGVRVGKEGIVGASGYIDQGHQYLIPKGSVLTFTATGIYSTYTVYRTKGTLQGSEGDSN